jgi:hypothetical protein
MATLTDQFQEMSTTDASPNLDTLPDDILQLIITHLQTEIPEQHRNIPLRGVEKDAQDLIFQRPPWNKDLDNLALVCARLRDEAFWKVRMRVLRVADTEADLKRTFKIVRESKRHHVRWVTNRLHFRSALSHLIIYTLPSLPQRHHLREWTNHRRRSKIARLPIVLQ